MLIFTKSLFILLIANSYAFVIEHQALQKNGNENYTVQYKLIKKSIQPESSNLGKMNLELLVDVQIDENTAAENSREKQLCQETPGDENPNTVEEVRVERSQIDENSILKQLTNMNSKLQFLQSVFDKNKSSNKLDSNEVNQKEVCNRMVGLNKSPECKYIENIHIEHINSSKIRLPENCEEIQSNGGNKSGIYEIQPCSSPKPLMVFCDMEVRRGGWTVLLNRFDGSEDFYKDWRHYKFGFGNLDGEYWLGLENIYHITGSHLETYQLSQLLVELTDKDNIKTQALYKLFAIGPETEGYELKVLQYFMGDTEDSLSPHLHYKFSTFDLDQDTRIDNCAELYRGGWWYNNNYCYRSQLTGKYTYHPLPEKYKYQGIHWFTNKSKWDAFAGARMMVRPTPID